MRHQFTSAKSDGPDGTLVRPSNWNAFLVHGEISPAQITASQNNFQPSGIASETHWRLSADALGPWTITGIAGVVSGKQIHISNVGANSFNLGNEDAGSNAENRIITGTGAALAVAADATVTLIYDGNTARWRVFN